MMRLKTVGRLAPRVLGAAVGVGSVACQELPEQPELRLAELKTATMRVSYLYEGGPNTPPDLAGDRVEVTFPGAPTDCFTFASDVKATLGGHAMKLVPGERDSEACGATSFRLLFTDVPGLREREPKQDVVELSDRQDVFRVTVQGLTAPHGLWRLEPRLSYSLFAAGETLVYDWDAATDLLEEAPASSYAHFTLLGPEGRIITWQYTEAPLTGDRKFEVPLPESLPAGDVVFALEGAARMPVLSCEGPAACEAPARYLRFGDAKVSSRR
ncbi:hypothetical protein ACLESD_18360 [Pyxidicoccus sp. 3LFB2]